MKLYFVRHGESEANVLRIISNRDLPHSLTNTGRQQALALAQRLQACDITQIFTSPILRAVETATIIGQQLGLTPQTADALREYDCGVLEGKGDGESWRLHEAYARAWLQERDWARKPEQGECFFDIRQRFVPFVQQLVAERNQATENVLLVGHGGLYHLMLPLLLRNIDDAFISMHGIGHTCCIVAEPDSAGLLCLTWNDTPAPATG
jgi:broad specificity phosphatase PhoE